jgi:hypothetical protein
MHHVFHDESPPTLVSSIGRGRERFSRTRFIAEQTRIYDSVFRTTQIAALAAAAC